MLSFCCFFIWTDWGCLLYIEKEFVCVYMAGRRTRGDDICYRVLGCSLDEEKDLKLYSSRFPSNKEVCLCLLANRKKHSQQNKSSGWKHQAIHQVFSQLAQHTKNVICLSWVKVEFLINLRSCWKILKVKEKVTAGRDRFHQIFRKKWIGHL